MGKLLLAWVLSLVLVAGLAAALTAQVIRSEPRILTGTDVGFRLEGTDRFGKPVGRLVIRINNEWVVPAAPIEPHQATMN